MDPVHATYTVPLALFDVVPVVLSVVGCWLLARLSVRVVPSVRVASYLAVVLIAAGGGAKALWKIILTTSGADVTWLEQLLFPFLATGFVLLAWTVWSGLVGREVVYWPGALFLAVGFVGALLARGMGPLVGVAATASLVTSGLAIRWAVRERTYLAGVLFVVGMASSIGLAFLASPRIGQTLTLQWVEEGVNTVGQACFLLASLLLFRAASLDLSEHAVTRAVDLTDTDTAVDV